VIELLAQRVDPKQVVTDGYDAIFDRYEQWADGEDVRGAKLDAAIPLVPSRAAALDLGCGTGTKATARLAREFSTVTAVDISSRSIDAARRRVPGVEFRVGDMTALDISADTFDLVTAFYSILHVPASQQPALVDRIATWLVPGGVLLFNVGLRAGDGGEEDWLGVPMYWSSLGYDGTLAALADARLEIVTAEVETTEEHGADATFLWVTARRGE
jgi:SAM-dependent methyltransferase